jgi:hypothetical protein
MEAEAYYVVYKSNLGVGYKVREKKLDGRNHLVVPVTMMVEGVHSGSRGPLFHSISELGKYPAAWDGRPVTINHPQVDGNNVSANDPEILEIYKVGNIFNTKVKGEKLTAEAWLDIEKLKAISPEVFEAIEGGKLLEVSVGVFSDEDDLEGEWQGETYQAIAKNHRPDHLALLPCSVGACSLADGCGLGVNKEGTVIDSENAPATGEQTEVPADTGEEKAIDSGQGGVSDFNNNEKKEVISMSEKSCTPCVTKKVDELIANGGGKFTEAHREWLSTFTEEQLDLMAPTVVEKEKVIEVNAISDEEKVILANAKKALKEKRESTIRSILDNTRDIWTPEVLNGMDDGTLDRVLKSIKKEVVADYSAAVPSFPTQSSTAPVVAPLLWSFNNK